MERKVIYQNGDGVRRTSVYDEDTKRFGVNTEQDLEPILNGILRDRENHRERTTNKVVARVPMVIYERSMIQQWDEADWKKWLNDPDNAAFRVWQGRV